MHIRFIGFLANAIAFFEFFRFSSMTVGSVSPQCTIDHRSKIFDRRCAVRHSQTTPPPELCHRRWFGMDRSSHGGFPHSESGKIEFRRPAWSLLANYSYARTEPPPVIWPRSVISRGISITRNAFFLNFIYALKNWSSLSKCALCSIKFHMYATKNHSIFFWNSVSFYLFNVGEVLGKYVIDFCRLTLYKYL